MPKRVFTANVVLRKERGSEPQQFKIGDEVPEWATVGNHVTQGVSRASDAPDPDESSVPAAPAALGADETPEEPADDENADDEEVSDYAEYSVEELKGEAKAREIKGYSKMTRDQLVAALESDDEETEEA